MIKKPMKEERKRSNSAHSVTNPFYILMNNMHQQNVAQRDQFCFGYNRPFQPSPQRINNMFFNGYRPPF